MAFYFPNALESIWQIPLYFLVVLIAANIISSITLAIYSIYLHPLRNFKCPRLWIAFPLFRSFAQVRGQQDFQIRKYHNRYGPVVRIGPNELAFTSGQAWKDICAHGHAELPK